MLFLFVCMFVFQRTNPVNEIHKSSHFSSRSSSAFGLHSTCVQFLIALINSDFDGGTSFSTSAGKYEALNKSARGLALRMLDPPKNPPQPFSNLLAGEEM